MAAEDFAFAPTHPKGEPATRPLCEAVAHPSLRSGPALCAAPPCQVVVLANRLEVMYGMSRRLGSPDGDVVGLKSCSCETHIHRTTEVSRGPGP